MGIGKEFHMSSTFSRTLTILTAAAILAAAPAISAQADKKASASVAGKWTVSVPESPHGNMTLGLTLKQEGTHVTGTFSSPHGDMPVDGDYAEGTLKLSTTGGDADSQIRFEARMKDDGSLDGSLSSEMGDMRWTAQRIKDKQ
jgi:hypothetical protein